MIMKPLANNRAGRLMPVAVELTALSAPESRVAELSGAATTAPVAKDTGWTPMVEASAPWEGTAGEGSATPGITDTPTPSTAQQRIARWIATSRRKENRVIFQGSAALQS